MRKILKEQGSLSTLIDYYGQDFAFDIETTGLDPTVAEIVGLGLYFQNDDAFYIVLKHTVEKWDGTTYLEHYISDEEFNTVIAGLFAQKNVRMSAHNGKFDLRFLWRRGIDTHGIEFDTLLAGKLLDENRSNGLKNLAKLVGIDYGSYQTLTRYKGFDKDAILGSPLDEVAQYAMNDVEATWKLTNLFTDQLKAHKVKNKSFDGTLFDVFTDLWMPLSRVLGEMEERGILIDRHKAVPAKEEYQAVIDHHLHLIRVIGLQMLADKDPFDLPDYYWRKFGKNDPIDETKIVTVDDEQFYEEDGNLLPLFKPTPRSNYATIDFNPGSPYQLYDIIYEFNDIKLPDDVKLLKSKNGKNSTDVKNIKTILYYMKDDAPEVLNWIIEWRRASKFVSTYLDTFIEKVDTEGKLHGNFNQAETDQGNGGTTTHRLSSSSPNMQNIQAHGPMGDIARSCFIAGEGNILVCADYGMMELRMFAHYSQDARMIAAFEQGRDLHIEMGAFIGQMTYEELYAMIQEKNPEGQHLRQLGKTMNFSLGFGMMAKAFQRYLLVNNKVEVTLNQSEDYIRAHGEMWNGVTKWRGQVHEFVREHGYVTSLFGSVRRLPDAQGHDNYLRFRAERQAVSKIIQGSCGEFICTAMIPMQPALKALGGSLLLQVHDELVAEVPEKYGMAAKSIMETMMMKTGDHLLTVPMVVDAHTGKSWYEAKGK